MTDRTEALALWAGEMLRETGPKPAALEFQWQPLAGDAGARRYFRLEGAGLIAMNGPDPAENLAWLNIGRHLKARGLPLPEIRAFDLKRGFFLLDDLGDSHLAKALRPNPAPETRADLLKTVRVMADFHREGLRGFQTAWCFQEPAYNADMIFKREIVYFLDSFMTGYLKEPESSPELMAEALRFSRMLESEAQPLHLIHRDFQARNVMLTITSHKTKEKNNPFLIDWQGARLGPGAYDLASLLNDPSYAEPPPDWREDCVKTYLKALRRTDEDKFRRELLMCGAARLMQNLGACGKLCGEGKDVAHWARPAAARLVRHFADPALSDYPLLAACAKRILEKR